MAEKLDHTLCEAGAGSKPLDLGDDEEEGNSLILGFKSSVEDGSDDAETLKALLEVRTTQVNLAFIWAIFELLCGRK